jgi:hypothetical protein
VALPDRLTSVPATITAGDTVRLTLAVADASAADGGTLSFAMAGAVVLTPITGAANGAAWDVTLSSAVTTTLTAGTYQWRVRLTESGVVRTVQTGATTVVADLATVAAGAAVSWEEKALPIVEAALSGTIEGEMKMFMIGGRQVMTFSLKELMTLRSQLLAAIAAKRGTTFGVPIRFNVVGTTS